MKFSPNVLEGFVRRVYGKKYDVKHDIDAQAWREVLRIMNEATVEGIMQSDEPPTHDMDFYKALRHSNEVFSAFKVHTMGKEMAAKLTGADGKLKPFSEWRRDIESIASHQVGSWLQTEYNTAVVRAHAAADWQQYERDKDVMPMLRWMPTTSAEPELTHRKFWNAKVNLPIDDPFWTKHYPGDHWNCKCSLEQNDDPAVRTNTDMDDVPQRGLEGNPGITKEIFSDKHPYFATSCDKCGFNKSGLKNRLKVLFRDQDKDCYNCPYANGCLEKVKNEFSETRVGDGRVLVSQYVNTDDSDYEKLMQIATEFAKMGKTVHLMPKMTRPPQFDYERYYKALVGTKYEGKCPDLFVDGVFYEHEGFVSTNPKNALRNMFNDGLKQSNRLIFDQPELTDAFIKRSIKNRQANGSSILEVWLRTSEGVRLLYKKSEER